MKEISSLILAVSMLAAFAVTLASCGKDGGVSAGIYEDGGKTYFVVEGGAIVIDGDTAAPTAAPELSGDPKSEKLSAPAKLDKEYFTYETKNGGKYITGLTDDGKSASVLAVPGDVAGIAKGAFSGGSLKSLVIASRASGAVNLDNGAFEGTSGLSVYIACTTDGVTAGKQLLDGASGIKLIITADEYSNFKSHYLFGTFSDNMSKL